MTHRLAGKKLSDLKVLIVGNNHTGSAPIRAFRFLRDQKWAKRVTFIGHPLAEESVRRSQFLQFETATNQERERAIRREPSLGSLSYVVDILATLRLLVSAGSRYDLYIGSSPHLGLLGLILRALGIVRHTVFWTVDYFPNRFANAHLNRLYLKLDETCVIRSDYAWNLTAAMGDARRERGIRVEDGRMYTVPHPIEDRELRSVPTEGAEPDALLYSGLLKPEYGFDLLLDALPLVAEKRPGVKVTITTYGEIADGVEKALEERGLEGRFRMLGYVADHDEYSRVVQRHRLGLATYRPTRQAYKRYADVSRAKTYLARGLPVVITRVPPIAAEIEREGAGIVIDYDKQQLAEAILKLLSDDGFHRQCRENAIALAQQYRADKVFSSAFECMGIEV